MAWRSANIIGSNSTGGEISGKVITAADMMMAYSRKFKGLPGRVRFQVNVSNLFDNTDIIPVRLSTGAAAWTDTRFPAAAARPTAATILWHRASFASRRHIHSDADGTNANRETISSLAKQVFTSGRLWVVGIGLVESLIILESRWERALRPRSTRSRQTMRQHPTRPAGL
jgi:hypothetical protein